MELGGLVITHKRASIHLLEEVVNDTENLLRDLYAREDVEECFVLKTCNRFEVYVVRENPSKLLIEVAKELGVPIDVIELLDHNESLMHLLRVASGLESMIVGEDQILSQLKDDYLKALSSGTLGHILNTALVKSIQVGRRVRTESRINRGSVSIASVAVDLAEERLGTLNEKTVMIIGAGEIGTLVTRTMCHRNVKKLYVTNRTSEKAQKLVDEIGGTLLDYSDYPPHLRETDVVISATSAPHIILDRERVEMALDGTGKGLLIIDIANPRDVDPHVAEIGGVTLYNIDELREISNKNLQLRVKEVKVAEKIINREFNDLKRLYKRKRADFIIGELYSDVEELKKKEIKKALNRLATYHTLTDGEKEIVQDLVRSVANKLLYKPTCSLKDAAEQEDSALLENAIKIFGLEKSSQEIDE
ncbi:MAG: glutamyl-tRNA reductase [Methermicoccaceae archaeon]